MSVHLFRDPWLKAVALALAVMLWMAVSGEPVVERGLEVPLQFENVPEGLMVLGDHTNAVSVRVHGPSSALDRLGVGSVVARLDLTGETPGSKLYDLYSDRVEVPPGVEVTRVVPATVAFTLERTGTIGIVPIVPNIEDLPPDGLTVGQIVVVPPQVEVIGPETRVLGLREAMTEPVSVAAAMHTVVADVTVGVADPTIRLMTPLVARVTVEIVPAPVEQTIHDVPVVIRDPVGATHVEVAPARVSVTVRGPATSVKDLNIQSVTAFVDARVLAELPRRRYNLPIAVESITGLRIVQIEPPSVAIELGSRR